MVESFDASRFRWTRPAVGRKKIRLAISDCSWLTSLTNWFHLMNTPIVLLLLNSIATWFMVGLIWVIQIVHYPLFAAVGEELYPAYQKQHEQLITWVVFPPMVIELVTAIMLLSYRPPEVGRLFCWGGLGLVVLIWLSTAFLQVPCHARLGDGFDEAAHRFLVHSNWVRTVAWSLRGGLVLWMLWLLVRPVN